MFLKPKGWIRHRTLDETDMLFCSLACFKAFADDEQAATSKRQKKPVEAQEAQLLATLAR